MPSVPIYRALERLVFLGTDIIKSFFLIATCLALLIFKIIQNRQRKRVFYGLKNDRPGDKMRDEQKMKIL